MEDRESKIKELRKQKWSWQAIGVCFGVSAARAHQIGSGYQCWTVKNYRLPIFQRDNFKCQKCERNNSLIIHHKDGNDRNCDWNNLITLCRKCHNGYHLTKEKFCKSCGKEIFIKKRSKYCNKKCMIDCHNKKWKRICGYCGKEFIVRRAVRFNYYRNHEKFNRKSYCSFKCYLNKCRNRG